MSLGRDSQIEKITYKYELEAISRVARKETSSKEVFLYVLKGYGKIHFASGGWSSGRIGDICLNKESSNDGPPFYNTKGVEHLDDEAIKRVYNSEPFQRALMGDSAVGLEALTILLPKEQQTAKLICEIMQKREKIYGETEQCMFFFEPPFSFMRIKEDKAIGWEWTNYAAFNDIMEMRNVANKSSKYGVEFSNSKGKIHPGEASLGGRWKEEDLPYNLKSAFKYLAEQERIMQQEAEKGK